MLKSPTTPKTMGLLMLSCWFKLRVLGLLVEVLVVVLDAEGYARAVAVRNRLVLKLARSVPDVRAAQIKLYFWDSHNLY